MTGFFATIINLICFPFRLIGYLFGIVIISPIKFISDQMNEERKFQSWYASFKKQRKKSIRSNDEMW